MTDPAAPQTIKLSPFRIFRNRNFAWMWTGQLVETMGMALTSLASSILVFRLTDSVMSVSLMLMASAVPSLLVGLFAGVVVDRYDRRRIMIAADLIRAVMVLLIPFLVPHNIVWLYIIVMLNQRGWAILRPGSRKRPSGDRYRGGASLCQLVDGDQFIRIDRHRFCCLGPDRVSSRLSAGRST